MLIKKRVCDIVDINSLNYCASKDNPADLVTRFNYVNYSEYRLWREGPPLLKFNENTQDTDIMSKNIDTVDRLKTIQKASYEDNDLNKEGVL